MIYPLQPLPPMQRLGWLPDFKKLRCRKTFRLPKLSIFTAGREYDITTERVKVQLRERRARRDGVCEPMLLSGSEMMVRIKDNSGNWHRCIADPQGSHALIHDLQFLVDHFNIPDVPDLASVKPEEFEEYKRRLEALER